MNNTTIKQLKKIDNILHENDLLIGTLKGYCKYELDSSIQIESILLQLNNILKNHDKIQKIVSTLQKVPF